MICQPRRLSGLFVLWLIFLTGPVNAHTNRSLVIDSFAPTSGPAGTVTTLDFTYSIFHVGHNPPINNVFRVLLDGVVVATGGNNHANTGTGNETYSESESVTIPAISTPGTYTITVQTLHSPSGTQGCSFTINNACRRTASVTFTIPDESDMTIDLSGLPTTGDLNQAYSGTFTCTNDAASNAAAAAASCAVTGLPAGMSVTSCTPAPPASVAIGASITCSVGGAPTATGVSNVNGTTGATNDINGGAGSGGNNSANTTITVAGSDMAPDLSGLPATSIVDSPYSGTFTCDTAGPNAAVAASCSVSGLPTGVTVTSCIPSPPATVANGASITCSVSGTPTATTTASVTVTTGASNDTNGGTGTGGNNQASTNITASAIETTKTGSTTTNLGNLAGITDAGDRVDYTITVSNTGTSTVTGVNVSDALSRQGGGVLVLTSGPTFDSNDGASPAGTLASGETATFLASYTFVQADIDAGGVSNAATGQATSPGGSANDVTDVSDDGDDGDGNTTNDPTVSNIAPSPSLSIIKVADDDTLRDAGDTIVYTYTVTNTGNVTINGVSISDSHNGSGPAPTPDNEVLSTDNPPLGDSTDAGTNASWDTLAPGDVVQFTGNYLVTQNDVDTLQ